MNDEGFTEELKKLLQSLETLSQYPQFLHLCNAAQGTGENTLGDALQAIDWACYHDLEASPAPNWAEIFGEEGGGNV